MWATVLSILLLSVLAGSWHVAGYAATRFWVMLFPPALGLLAFIPPLRFSPLGLTNFWVWIIDLSGVVITLGNTVRMVGQSFLLRSDLATFAGQFVANVLVSALTGLLLGLLVGLVAALLRSSRLA